jgi:hypothetical protein
MDKPHRAQRAAAILKDYEDRHPELLTSMEQIVDTFLVDLMLYCEMRFGDNGFDERVASAKALLP